MLAFILTILIALLDTGVMADHVHFADTVITGDLTDTCGHGTAMAGILADTAPLAHILSVDISTNCLSHITKIQEEIRLAVDAGADIIVVAWKVDPKNFLTEVTYAQANNAIIIFSSGLDYKKFRVPALNGEYTWMSGTSMAAAYLAGLLARSHIYFPKVRMF